MSSIIIQGGGNLEGVVSVHGAKNSVLPILAATIVGNGQSVIHNCPDLKDVDSTIRILRHLGCNAYREANTVFVDTRSIKRYDIPDCLMREMRSSVVFLGAILARCRQAVMSYPGGCELGTRPIDLHLSALKALGTELSEESGNIICKTNGICGREITLTFPSVGATENIMLAACTGNGVTKINNAACEPEIEDLAEFLIACGAKIRGAGASSIVIDGVDNLNSAEHSIIPDRIVASTIMSAAAMTGGDVTLENVIPEHISTVISILEEMGCSIEVEPHSIRLRRTKPLKSVKIIKTMPYPGFPTDAQSPIMAVAARAEGTTVFVENIFESRYRHVGELTRMGADISVEGRVAVVSGVPKLYGTKVSCTDLRGGAALVVAALGAEGETEISMLHHIDRGYDKIENIFGNLGANIIRTDKPTH